VVKENGVRGMREIERKYEALDDVELLDPAGMLGVDVATGPQEQDLEAVSGGWVGCGLAPEAAGG
jgi:hypothetical protein